MVTNPPSFQRAGEPRELASLYRSIPEILRKLPTWSHFILTDYPQFESLIQKTADRRRKLYNGRLECTYYQFHGPRSDTVDCGGQELAEGSIEQPPLSDAVETTTVTEVASSVRKVLPPVFGGLTPKACEQAELFHSRLVKLARHLRRWPTRQGITCYRLYDRDIPEIPLVVDRYEDHLHMTEYERPHDRDIAQHADWLDLMVRTAGEALEIDRRHIFLKRRERQRGARQHERLADEHYELTVQEGGLRFIVNLSDYVDTGLFLDHRITRSMVRELAHGASVLNLFAYTGAFSVYAASGGAAHTTTVDWSRAYLEWANRNMELNGFAGRKHRFIREDARQFLRQLKPGEDYDLAIVDPPTFSNSKRTDEDWDIQRDHAELLSSLMHRMKPGGVIFFSTNFRQFKFDDAAVPASQIFEISRQTVPADFRNRRIHRCWKISVAR